eukprot:gnl/MRDRNA2_/MRDRNA2_116915_c0_seq1.p1 gnl/MRDRNA2_/MRDRNA2_116915_c0~~gnl/MRDRNA2_/MRDRNA2_116915_c0_seq1.p1  ORF type:complete len:393 (-),score=99.71 gnl/MRDRNA2_/MRDRNA2_116915_c0_seq1:17-1144(-)
MTISSAFKQTKVNSPVAKPPLLALTSENLSKTVGADSANVKRLLLEKQQAAIQDQLEVDPIRLKEAGAALRRWVRSCLNIKEQHEKLKEKGRLRAKLEVELSDDALKVFKEQVSKYEGIVKIVRPDKNGHENQTTCSSCTDFRVNLLVEFGKPSFELFLKAYPDAALPPNDEQLQEGIEREVEKCGVDKVSSKSIKESLEKRYGALVDESCTKQLAMAVVQNYSNGAIQRPAKRLKKENSGEKANSKATALVPRVKCSEDIKIAVRALAPMGFNDVSGAPVIRSPDEVVEAWMQELLAYTSINESILRETRIGALVKWYSKNTDAQSVMRASERGKKSVASLAESLIDRWMKSTVATPARKRAKLAQEKSQVMPR